MPPTGHASHRIQSERVESRVATAWERLVSAVIVQNSISNTLKIVVRNSRGSVSNRLSLPSPTGSPTESDPGNDNSLTSFTNNLGREYRESIAVPRASVATGNSPLNQLLERKPRATLASMTPNEGLEVKALSRPPRESLARPRAA